MAHKLQFAAAMRRLILLCVLLWFPKSPTIAAPQQPPDGVNPNGIVESAGISGIDEHNISEDVRDAIHKLEGKPFDQNAADELVVRIQAQQPKLTATVRLVQGSRADSVRLQFVIQDSGAQSTAAVNVNSVYTVERVDVEGTDQSKIKQATMDEMQKLVGQKLDDAKTNQILHEINRELRPRYSADKKVMKGSDPQHVVVVYEIHKTKLIPYIEIPSQRIVYHSKQNFSGDITVPIDMGHNNRLLMGASNDQDELLERFAGFNVGFESTKVGTDHLGVALRYARYHDRWQPATVAADRFGIYRERNTFDPSVSFGLDPRVRVSAGVSLSQLQIQYPATHQADVGAIVASFDFHNIWADASADRHNLDVGYDFRAGTHQLDSDFIYTRHLLHAHYVYGQNKGQLALSFLGGRISGNAPLFDAFSLGNTLTLRGWNKFDVAPAGGNRMIYGSVQYGFGKPSIGLFNINTDSGVHVGQIHAGFHLFYDVGAVGDSGSPIVARHSAGFGFGGSTFFIEMGFPIRSSNFEPVFSTGFRF
jgi:hypothetical protein